MRRGKTLLLRPGLEAGLIKNRKIAACGSHGVLIVFFLKC